MLQMQPSKLWIPTTLSALAFCFAGCAKREQVVWVDVNQATQHSGAIRLVFPVVNAVSAAAPQQSIGLPAIRPSPRGREQASQRREEALQLMQAQRAETLSELEEAYRRQLIATANSEAVVLTSDFQKKSERERMRPLSKSPG